MKCAICRHGITAEGYATVVLERGQTTIVFKKVPAQICDNCGEEYISESVNEALFHRAQAQWERGIIIEMLNFAA